MADSKENMPGTWSVSTDLKKAIAVKEGLEKAAGSSAKILYAKGSPFDADAELEKRGTMFGRELPGDNRTEEELLNDALAIANQSDVIVAALGESSEMSGESSSRTNIDIPQTQKN